MKNFFTKLSRQFYQQLVQELDAQLDKNPNDIKLIKALLATYFLLLPTLEKQSEDYSKALNAGLKVTTQALELNNNDGELNYFYVYFWLCKAKMPGLQDKLQQKRITDYLTVHKLNSKPADYLEMLSRINRFINTPQPNEYDLALGKHLRAALQQHFGYYQEALQAYEQDFDLFNKYSLINSEYLTHNIYLECAKINYKLGNYQAAERDSARALEFNPTDKVCLAFRQKLHDKALATEQEAKQLLELTAEDVQRYIDKSGKNNVLRIIELAPEHFKTRLLAAAKDKAHPLSQILSFQRSWLGFFGSYLAGQKTNSELRLEQIAEPKGEQQHGNNPVFSHSP